MLIEFRISFLYIYLTRTKNNSERHSISLNIFHSSHYKEVLYRNISKRKSS